MTAVHMTLLALLIEVVVGYPQWAERAIGHPVVWIGRLVAAFDRMLNREAWNVAARRAAGFFAALVLVGTAGGAAFAIESLLLLLPFGILAAALAASTLLAQCSLYQHVAAVAAALDAGGIAAGRAAVAHIVGRDPEALDEAGVARAAIESLAENFSDAVVAPVFWLCAGGLTGGAAYKAVNTADSMIGHRAPRHRAFGFAAARLDDLVNLPASRIAVLLLLAAAGLTPGASARDAWRAVRRDAPRHRSPNAGYPEAAMAGALGLALAGPRAYAGVTVEDAFMGDGRREATTSDIRAALRLYRRADALLIGLIALLALLVTGPGR
jgi:adenosylcobinamide-phosphate synthase